MPRDFQHIIPKPNSWYCLQQQGESSRLSTQSEMAEQRAHECETALKDATAQMRSLTSRITALEAQLRAKESEAEEIQATMTASRKGSSEIEARGIQLQADLRGACADIASLTAQLGVQTAVAQSRDVEIEELKAAVREAGVRQEAAGDALDDTVGENKRLSMQCAQLQCSLKTQVRSTVCLFIYLCYEVRMVSTSFPTSWSQCNNMGSYT